MEIFVVQLSNLLPESECVCQVSFTYEIVASYQNWRMENMRSDEEKGKKTGKHRQQCELY